MKKGHVALCPKTCNKSLSRQRAEINFLRQFVQQFPFHLSYRRMPSQEEKEQLIAFIKAYQKLPMTRKLALISLSKSRFYSWVNKKVNLGCLNDYSSCPKRNSKRITFQEVQDIRALVEREDLNDMSLTSLYWYGRRKKLIHISISTWFKYIRRFGMLEGTEPRKWSRPDKKGIKAIRPNEIWHIDVTQIKLPDRSKVYVQVILDNYSRYIVAWKVFTKVTGLGTRSLIEEAKQKTNIEKRCRLVSDGGTENINYVVKACLNGSKLNHEIAQVDIDYSNSMVEAFFRSLKQYSVYKNQYDNFEYTKLGIERYIANYNEKIPRHVLGGITPLEKYRNMICISQFKGELIKGSALKRAERLLVNRNNCLVTCGA
jgi:putative transposase